MHKIHTIDLHFQEEKHSIAAYLVESEEGPILIETGPMSTFEALKAGIEQLGYQIKDIENVLLTHIHFDHAGAAWKFAEHGAKIFVSDQGVQHLHNPTKLWNSAKQIYQDEMESLWGDMKPIPEDQLEGVRGGTIIEFGDVVFKVLYTPGHAVHHNAYQLGDVIFTGDVAGVKIDKGPVVPPCPPPDINLKLWKESIQILKNENPKALYLTHYGRQGNPIELLNELEVALDSWANFIKPYYKNPIPIEDLVDIFMDFTQNQYKEFGLSEDEIAAYEYANPSWMSVNGLLRYWRLLDEGRI